MFTEGQQQLRVIPKVVFTLKPQLSDDFMQHELDSAVKSVKAKKDVLILGPEKIGKSSSLLNIREKLKSKQFVPVIFSAQNCIDLKGYIKNNLLRILEAHEDIFPEPKQLFSLSLLELDRIISCLDLQQKTKESLKLLLIFENDPRTGIEDVLKELFMLPQLIAGEKKAASVILLDDADRLDGIKSGKASASLFFGWLGELDSVFVLASAYRLPVEGFEEIALAPLTIDQTRSLLKQHELSLDERSLTTIYNFAEGVPFYINYFGRLIRHTAKTDSNTITYLMDDALDNELHFYFTEKLKSLSPKELPILFCMAENDVNTPSRISKILDYSQTNVRRFLSIMEEKGFVSNPERGVFNINDPVFRRWLEVQSR